MEQIRDYPRHDRAGIDALAFARDTSAEMVVQAICRAMVDAASEKPAPFLN